MLRRRLAPVVAMMLLVAAIAQAAPPPGGKSASDVVYLSKTGQKYHRKDCRTLKYEPTKTTRGEAEKGGHTACKICKP